MIDVKIMRGRVEAYPVSSNPVEGSQITPLRMRYVGTGELLKICKDEKRELQRELDQCRQDLEECREEVRRLQNALNERRNREVIDRHRQFTQYPNRPPPAPPRLRPPPRRP